MMKSVPLLVCLLPLLSACRIFGPVNDDYAMKYYRHETEVTLKEGVPCFAPISDRQVRKEDAGIYSINVFALGDGWEKTWDEDIFLSGGGYIPYGGDSPLKTNTLYHLDLGVLVKGQKPFDTHVYSTIFCLSEGADNKTNIVLFARDENPETCPSVAENDGDAP
jgi:hypothetical protein